MSATCHAVVLLLLSRDCGPLQVDTISRLPGLLAALQLMDAAVQQNVYHEKLLLYRDVLVRPEVGSCCGSQ